VGKFSSLYCKKGITEMTIHEDIAFEVLQADGLPGILVSNRPLRAIASDALCYLTQAQTSLYVRHGQLVRIQCREDGTPCIETLSEAALKGILARSMNFAKAMNGGPQHIPPPDNVVRDILSLGAWPFPALDTIVEFPVFRPDGTLIYQPGYDSTTHLVYVPDPHLHIPPIPFHPTSEDITAARSLVQEAVGEFPYQDSASYANAIALLLTPLIRQAIDGHVPLALIDATRSGTGKTLLAETVALIATGRRAALMAAPYDDDEWRKRIASTLSEGATVIIFDNLRGRLQSASLDLALTSHTVQERILGQSKNGTYAQRATWIATGNNVQIGGDLPRRSYWIRMDAQTDKPWTRRGYKHDLLEWVPEHRGALIAALLTIARAWYAAGKPHVHLPSIGGFQKWVDTVGGILAYVGIPCFLGNLDAHYEQADNEALQWPAFLHAWYDRYQDREVLVADVVRDIITGACKELAGALPDELSDVHTGDLKRRLGKALAQRVGSRYDESGLHFVRASINRRSGAVYWKAGVQVSQVSTPQKSEME
jgi:hypothetical protein